MIIKQRKKALCVEIINYSRMPDLNNKNKTLEEEEKTNIN